MSVKVNLLQVERRNVVGVETSSSRLYVPVPKVVTAIWLSPGSTWKIDLLLTLRLQVQKHVVLSTFKA